MSVTFSAELTGEPVNLNNVNAARVLGVLGYLELYGDEDAGLFLGRVLLALAVDPEDAGRPVLREGRYVDCGRSEGYTGARLLELHALAQYARTWGRHVTWG